MHHGEPIHGTAGPLDVVIVGAGLAGLCAARALVERGAHCVVLEAQHRVGGRTLSQELAGAMIDLGGQWIGPTQDRLAALAKELGVSTFPQYHTGRKLLSWNGKLTSYAKDLPPLPILSQFELLLTDRRWKKFVDQIPPEAPWRAPLAAEWDSMTLESWKNRNLRTAGGRLFVDVVTRAVLTSEPRDVSLLFFLSYLRWGHGLERLISIGGGAQQDRFAGGAQQISERLAAKLGPCVIQGAAVRAIEQTTDGVKVSCDGGTYRAGYSIVAVPPMLAGRIEYAAALPAKRDQLTARMPMGSVIKYVAAYERPFWREAGFSGEAVSDTGITVTTFDDSSDDASHAALVTFSDGQAARDWSDRTCEERRAAVLAELVRFFGPEAARPVAFVEKNWNLDPWSRGCYVGVTGPGALTSFGEALREPCGRIHWAGTETATEWMGYMDGAIQSGHRAADEVHARLQAAART
ncbi:MAG: flavin monoamine oxidase family protein [Pirellulales bacterium]